MNTKELMIHVERIVRPLHADAPRKLRMRRELLAHLEASVEEQRARGLDEEAAVAEAKRRLGDPAELSRDLQATVPRLERWGSTLLFRLSGRNALAIGFALTIVVGIVTYLQDPPPHSRAILVAALLVLELNMVIWGGFFISVHRQGVSWSRRIWLGMTAIIVQPVWVCLLSYAANRRFVPENLGQAAIEQFLLPLFFVPWTLFNIILNRQSTEWADLNIAG